MVTQALSKYPQVKTVAFDYGQRHIVELDARLNVLREIEMQFPQWANKLGAGAFPRRPEPSRSDC